MKRNKLLATFVGFSPVMVLGTACTEVGHFDARWMLTADRLMNEAIDCGAIPGAVLLVGHGDEIVHRKAYGYRALRPARIPMTVDTIFDLASLTKPVACATSIMLLVERGSLNLSDRVSRHIPAFGANGKQGITVAQLLLHTSGLVADNPLADYRDGPTKALANICALETVDEPGTAFRYSDVGYIVLGELVRRVAGRSLDRFAREEIFAPLGMQDTCFNPAASRRRLCAPTEQRDGRWMIGEVHDPRAYALNGMAGHAGLFGTADDLARWCRMILKRGSLGGRRILSADTVDEMTKSRCLDDGEHCRAYGFDVDTEYSSARGNLFEPGATFGHTGFTGTSFWIDPNYDCYVILLSNRVHPDGTGKVVDLRRRVATAVARAVIGRCR